VCWPKDLVGFVTMLLWCTVQDGMVIKATKAEHGQRGARLLRGYSGGAQVPRYARKPVAAGGQPAPAGQTAGVLCWFLGGMVALPVMCVAAVVYV
jgi:hypothetical protein